MVKFFIAANGPEDWKELLADPDKQWRTGFSAKSLAYCWEDAQGFPGSVQEVFVQSGLDIFEKIEFLAGIPEHQTPLPGGRRPSQSDIFVLARSQEQLIAITVEGKVNETFGPTVGIWREPDSRGKRVRLSAILDILVLSDHGLSDIRYQLLHRTASSLIEAERFHASTALMMVHSFSQEQAWFDDYQSFLKLFGECGAQNSITSLGNKNGIELFTAWVTGEERFLKA